MDPIIPASPRLPLIIKRNISVLLHPIVIYNKFRQTGFLCLIFSLLILISYLNRLFQCPQFGIFFISSLIYLLFCSFTFSFFCLYHNVDRVNIAILSFCLVPCCLLSLSRDFFLPITPLQFFCIFSVYWEMSFFLLALVVVSVLHILRCCLYLISHLPLSTLFRHLLVCVFMFSLFLLSVP